MALSEDTVTETDGIFGAGMMDFISNMSISAVNESTTAIGIGLQTHAG